MKVNYEISPIIKAIYELYISPAEKKRLAAEDGRTYDKTGRYVRVQCYLPTEVYAILKMFGAFKGSETAFFSDAASQYIEQRALELKLMPAVLAHIKAAQ